MAGLNGELVTIVVNYQTLLGLGSLTFEDVEVGEGVEILETISLSLGIEGNLAINFTDTGYTTTFTGIGFIGNLSVTVSDLVSTTIGAVTDVNSTGSSGVVGGVVALLEPVLETVTGVVTTGFNLIGTLLGPVSQTVELVLDLVPLIDPDSLTLDEGTVTTLTAALLNVSDDGPAEDLLFTITTALENGTLFLDGNEDGLLDIGEQLLSGDTFTLADLAGGLIKYVHDGTETLTDVLGFDLTDGITEILDNVLNVVVNGQNDAPVVGELQNWTTDEDVPTAITGLSVSDADLTLGDVTVTLAVATGTLTGLDGVGVTVSGSGTGTLILVGSVLAINTYLSVTPVQYVPVANASGEVSLTVTVDDGPLEDSSVGTITITAVNDAAVAANDAFATAETAVLSNGNLFANNGSGADVDVDSALQITKINGVAVVFNAPLTLASGARLTVSADGSFVYNPMGKFEDLPVGTSATDSFTYEIAGGSVATATVTINGVDNNDSWTGQSTAESLFGGIGNDTIAGGGGSDIIDGGIGNDVLVAGLSAETLKGGLGIDLIDYSASAAAVVINLGRSTATGGAAAGDRISGFERVAGSDLNDRIVGDGKGNAIAGLGGADRMNGGRGYDTLTYADSESAVRINLKAGTGAGGDAAGDQFKSFEAVTGSSFDDLLIGNAARNILRGGDGSDRMNGGVGKDRLFGGDGNDVFIFSKGRDVVFGGADLDIARFAGSRTDYRIVNNANGSHTVIDKDSGAAMILFDVEQAQFANRTVVWDTIA